MAKSFEQKEELLIVHGNMTFEDWLTKPFVGRDLRDRLTATDVLLIPWDGYGDYIGPLFPEGTEMLFDYLQGHLPNGFALDACVEDDAFRTLSLHNDLIRLGSFLLTSVVVPVFLNVISAYITQKLQAKEKESWVELEMTVCRENGSSSSIRYKGPVQTFTDEICDRMDLLLAEQGTDDAQHNAD